MYMRTWTLVQNSANMMKHFSVIVNPEPQLKSTFHEMAQHVHGTLYKLRNTTFTDLFFHH